MEKDNSDPKLDALFDKALEHLTDPYFVFCWDMLTTWIEVEIRPTGIIIPDSFLETLAPFFKDLLEIHKYQESKPDPE